MATILILDQEIDSRLMIKRLLERNGHSVFTAASRSDLLSHVSERKFDLVILTENFRTSSELTTLIKKQSPCTRVMAITNYSAFDAQDEILLDDYLIKPVDIDAIETKVNELLDSRYA